MRSSQLNVVSSISRCFSATVVFICLHLVLTIAYPGNERDFMYPDSAIEPICKKKESSIYCTEVLNYPTAEIEQIIKADLDKYNLLFGEDYFVHADVSMRFDGVGEESLCISNERLIFPQMGRNKNDALMHIVNTKAYPQGIRIQECLSSVVNGTCYLSEHYPNHYKSTCRQEYSYRPLLAYLNGTSQPKKVMQQQFQFPASCKCKVYSQL